MAVQGGGSIQSEPAGISCGAACRAHFPEGSRVVLTAVPAQGWMLGYWFGDCEGATERCEIVLDAAKTATATFLRPGSPIDPGGETHTRAGLRDETLVRFTP